MIYLELFLGFLKVGLFAFGGAYGAIPLIRDVVMGYGWLTDQVLSNMIAVSESTPGPIMVNLATYVGSHQAGFLGALLATTAVVLPSFVIILLVTAVLKAALKNRWVRAGLAGMKPCVVGIILATGVHLLLRAWIPHNGDLRAVILTALLLACMFGWKKIRKKKISPIALIVISAVLGAVIYAF